jgi:hypothetical protein
MKRFLFIVLLTWSGFVQAQSFNNEWIDYNKTYYKFFVGSNGLYRINQSVLAGLGIGNTPAEQFQLWRNGAQVPVFTSVPTGPLGAADFIEFFGEMNDGRPDKIMYRVEEHQLNDKWSLETDTAAYFLTINPAGNNLRMTATSNNLVAGATPEPFFYHTLGVYYKQRINPGYAAIVGSAIYSSNYDQGEGWASTDIGQGTVRTENLTGLFPFTGAGANTPILRVNALGNALNPRRFSISVNGTQYDEVTMDYFDYVRRVVSVPVTAFAGGTAAVAIRNMNTTSDRMALAQIELLYARLFNFGGANQFAFQLSGSASGNYLEISGFNHGGVAPILYDFTNGQRYLCDIATPGVVKVQLLPASGVRRLQLLSQATGIPQLVTSITQRNFVNYGLLANQGNYLMITHASLTGNVGATSPVEDYRSYRSSVLGGGHNVKVYLIDQLIDQFAFGIRLHPLSVRNFIRYARATFAAPVKNVMLLGKGVEYVSNRNNLANPDLNRLSFIPTFGTPASDILLAADPGLDVRPKVSIGRLSAISADEIRSYLDKVLQYEQQLVYQSPLISDKAWTKNVVHVIGSGDGTLGDMLTASMNGFSNIIKDTFYGANVHTFSKLTTAPVEQANAAMIYNLFEQGIGMLTYFGHSSASTLEFNLDNPDSYNNQGKYPLFVLLGCNAGNFYTFNLQRLFSRETISEKFVLAPQRGSIATIASTGLGIVNYLDIYHGKTLNAASTSHYGGSVGDIMRQSISDVFELTTQDDFFARFHCEQSSLHGDPALTLKGSSSKPDYVIEDQQVRINPNFVSVADANFKVEAAILNLGKAINRDIVVEVKRTYPDQSTEVIIRDTISGIRFSDTVSYAIPIQALRDKGLNKISICLDADNVVDELYESNNCITKDVFIFEDEARPVYPYNFSIVNTQNIKLSASTANPLAPMKQYRMEIDTKELFNSPIKSSQTLSSTGGLLEFTPGLTFIDSTVYYWRVAPVPSSGQPVWNGFSFLYKQNISEGFGQSHYYQYENDSLVRLKLDANGRNWKFDSSSHYILMRNAVFPTAATNDADFVVAPDGDPYIRSACVGNSLIFNIFNPDKFVATPNPNRAYGSGPYCQPSRLWNFEFSYMNSAARKLAMDFMDTIPDGYIVTVRNIPGSDVSGFINDWKADTAIFGSGRSLYHKLRSVGFQAIDSFYRKRAFNFIYQKSNPNFIPTSSVSNGIYDATILTKSFKVTDSIGIIKSPVIGPAKQWKQIEISGYQDASSDSTWLDVRGVRSDGLSEPYVSRLFTQNLNLDISGMDPAIYPKLSLSVRVKDATKYTPFQLKNWNTTFVEAPEGVVSPNLLFQFKDSVDQGEPIPFRLAFKNVSSTPFDSLLSKLSVVNSDNITYQIPIPRTKAISAGDTIQLNTLLETNSFKGKNQLKIEVNAPPRKLEQYSFNNFLMREFYVRPDSLPPLVDLTFDGIHILEEDVVSSRPEILIQIFDDSRWRMMDDTSSLVVRVKNPSGVIRQFNYKSDTLRLLSYTTPPTDQNKSVIAFKPFFTEDGIYELILIARDKQEGQSGTVVKRQSFKVITRSQLSELYNYPNPFSTSTSFVFTINGSVIPSQLKIEIMTLTGKVVREITKQELGELRIGRNITSFKWDGTDQFGDRLANGIYLYRVIVDDDFERIKKSENDGFNRGYGKMYLFR